MDAFVDFFGRALMEMWEICEALGFWLLVGFVLAGFVGQLLPIAFVKKHLAGGGWRSVVKAVLIGVPLPLCSCGVIPVAASLRKAGASRGAVAAFTAATPQTGLESIAASWSLMGLPFTIGRVVADVAAGLFSGILINAAESRGKPLAQTPELPDCPQCEAQGEAAAKIPLRQKIAAALREGFIDLPAEISKYVLIGVVVGAFLTALFPDPSVLKPYLDNRLVAYLAVSALALPLYVCATGSIPIAYALVSLGFSPGAAIIFLVLGPATNPSAIAVLWKILGRRASILYLSALAVAAWAAAVAFDMSGFKLDGVMTHAHGHEGSTFASIFAALMLVVFAVAYVFRRTEGRACHQHRGHPHDRL